MAELIIDNYLIDASPVEILNKLQGSIINGKLSFYNIKNDSIQVQCPVHKDGHERRGSCFINLDDTKAPYLWAHCFTCGFSGPIEEFVAHCLDTTTYYGKRWLIENFGVQAFERELRIDNIKLEDNHKIVKKYLDESILNEFSDYHPYMTQRGLTDDIIKKFEIKYDPTTKCIVFPVRDVDGKLVGLTRRSTEGKKFIIDKGFSKENIYLLNNIINENIKEVVVAEGQIDALVSWVYGRPAIAMLGAGTTDEQMAVLNRSGIIHYILMYDNDQAGRKGAEKFKRLIRKDVFVDDIIMPEGKDIASISKEEFNKLIEL